MPFRLATSNRRTAAEPLIQTSLLGEAVDSGPLAIFVADEQMRYVAVNQYAADLLGYTRAELLELQVTDVARESDAPSQYHEMVETRRATGVAVLTRKDGTTVEFAYDAAETRVGGIPLYVSIGSPVSRA